MVMKAGRKPPGTILAMSWGPLIQTAVRAGYRVTHPEDSTNLTREEREDIDRQMKAEKRANLLRYIWDYYLGGYAVLALYVGGPILLVWLAVKWFHTH